MSKKLNFIDLFSGCGGFSYGLEMAGHNCLLGVDNNKDAIETFAINHPNASHFHGDISDLSNKKLKMLLGGFDVQMIVGGPPCQGFSTVGSGDVQDERNYLFNEFVRVVKLLQPQFIILENVTGLLANKNKKILDSIFKSFENLGYIMDARVLSSEEYGVPEKRRRTIITGCHTQPFDLFPDITNGARGVRPVRTVDDALQNLSAKDGEVHNHDVQLSKIKNPIELKRIECIPEGCYVRYKKDEDKYLPVSLKFGVDWEKLSEKRFRQAKLQRLDRSKPSPTILTSRTSYYHPIEDRYLTPREAAACQSFPGDFVFKGSITSQFRQIGNAVPPILAKSIGDALGQLKYRRLKSESKNRDFSKKAFHYNSETVA